MKKLLFFLATLLATTSCAKKRSPDLLENNHSLQKEDFECSQSAIFKPKVIYGEDNRLDLYKVCDEKKLELARSTVALIDKTQVHEIEGEEGIVELSSLHYGTTYDLCPEEPFYEQGALAFCSGFLVAPNIIVTAGHCIFSQIDCEETRFAFGYDIPVAGHNPTLLKNKIYTPAKNSFTPNWETAKQTVIMP